MGLTSLESGAAAEAKLGARQHRQSLLQSRWVGALSPRPSPAFFLRENAASLTLTLPCWGSATCPAVSRPCPRPAAGSRPW